MFVSLLRSKDYTVWAYIAAVIDGGWLCGLSWSFLQGFFSRRSECLRQKSVTENNQAVKT
jgi:hypothetical protein